MSTFVVSARKYRPTQFQDVVGQEHVSITLKNALRSDQVAHAFLFTGPRGVGKTTCARILAKTLNCENRTEAFEACGTCPSCERFASNSSFNIVELDAASNNSIEHIRALIEQVRFQPQHGQYKIFIIDEVHMLSQQAFNAFLKTLEEPPPYAVFILATTEKHKIIPTILSRCQIFDFRRIQVSSIVPHLQHIAKEEGIEAEDEALHLIAQKADGALRDALSIFDRIMVASQGKITYDSVIQNLNILDYDYYFKMVEALVTEDLESALLLYDQIIQKGFDGELFLHGISDHFRQLLVAKDESTLSLLENGDALRQRYQSQAQDVPTSFILTALNAVNESDIHYKMAKNKRLHVELFLIKMAHMGRMQAVEVPTEKKKLPLANVTAPATVKEPDQPYENSSDKAPLDQPDSKSKTPPPAPQQVESPKPVVTMPIKKKVIAPTAVVDQPVNSGGLSLDILDQAVAEEIDSHVEPEARTDDDSLAKAWNHAIMTITSKSTIGFLKESIRSIDEDTLSIGVSSAIAKEAVIQETTFVESIREQLHHPKLKIQVQIDPALSEKLDLETPVTEIKSAKSQLIDLIEQNPNIKLLIQRMDLKLEL